MNYKNFDTGSVLVILASFVLFVIALFLKGLTPDFLLEAAVFLVSVKLIMNAYKNIEATKSLHRKLDNIYEKLEKMESCKK